VSHGPRWVVRTYFGPERPVWLVQDQPFVDHKYDVLTCETDKEYKLEVRDAACRQFCGGSECARSPFVDQSNR